MTRSGSGRRSARVAAMAAHAAKLYTPTIWIDGPNMYATCEYLKGRSFVDTQQARRMTFENRLWRALKDDWGVLAQTLKLDYQTGRVLIKFDDDEEFVMTKLSNGGSI